MIKRPVGRIPGQGFHIFIHMFSKWGHPHADDVDITHWLLLLRLNGRQLLINGLTEAFHGAAIIKQLAYRSEKKISNWYYIKNLLGKGHVSIFGQLRVHIWTSRLTFG
jgi:hypothetical protein